MTKKDNKTVFLNPKLEKNIEFTTLLMSLGYDWKSMPLDDDIATIIAYENEHGHTTILIDSQEPAKIDQDFIAQGFTVKRQQIKEDEFRLLDVADPEMKSGVELKRRSDFISSISDGRLFLQASKMFYSSMRTAFIIVGDHFSGDDIFMHHILGAEASIAAQYRIPIMHVKNNSDAAYLAARFIAKGSNPKVISSTLIDIDTKLKKAAQTQAIYAAIDGIGELRAYNLALEFPSVIELITFLQNNTDKETSKYFKEKKLGIGIKGIQSIRNAFFKEQIIIQKEHNLEEPIIPTSDDSLSEITPDTDLSGWN